MRNSEKKTVEMPGASSITCRAATMDEARELADGDPMHAEGKRRYTLRKWPANESSPSFSMALSSQKISMR